MKTMIVFWLLGATGRHAKNFSVFLSTRARYRMTPVYDVISAQPTDFVEGVASAIQLGINKRLRAIPSGINELFASRCTTLAGVLHYAGRNMA
jgi:hypothetical protein